MYYPQIELNNGLNTPMDFSWEPMLTRYFKYSFPSEFFAIQNAQFNCTLLSIDNSSTLNVFMGTNDFNYCNYVLPSHYDSCPQLQSQMGFDISTFTLITQHSNATIYIAYNAGKHASITFIAQGFFNCSTGYIKEEQQCVLNGTNCPSGQYHENATEPCKNCSIWGCQACSNSTFCTECSSYNFTLQNGKCSCPSGQYQNPDTNSSMLCLGCVLNCMVCSNGTDCSQCDSLYSWNATSQQCVLSGSCPSGQYLNSTTQACNQCSAVLTNCEVCSNSSLCTQCINSGLTLANGQQFLFQFLTNLRCVANCTSGEYINPNITSKSAVCLSCISYCISCSNSTNCQECESSYIWNATSQSCTPESSSCSQGQYYNNATQTCEHCSWGCDICSNSTLCTQCSSNLTLYNGQCSCQSGEYQNPDTNSSQLCLGCMTNCMVCSNGTDCSQCDSLYAWNATSQQCVLSTSCPSGYFFNSTTQACNQCSAVLPNCQLCSNSSVCTKCQPGYNLPSGESSCVTEQVVYNWDLTDLSSYWQNGSELYWSLQLNYTANMTNVYSLLLNTNGTVQQTPGTIYIFYNINYSLHTVYVSTNCSTIKTCDKYTQTPSEQNFCWTAGNQSVWSMNTQKTEGQCYFYLSIPELTEIPQVNFAFFPQLTLSGTQNYTNLPVPWVFQTEQFFTYKFPDNYIYKNAQNGVHTINLSGMNAYIVSQMYLATDDSRYNSTCSTDFPEQSVNCGTTFSSYSVENTTYLSYTFSLDQATSFIVLGFMTHQYDSIKYFDFNSNITFSCNENYILNNNNCIKEQTQDLTNSSKKKSSGSSNQSYWNVSIDPSSIQGEEKVFNVKIEPINFPGTFYLSSQLLSTVYVTTNCNSTTPCTAFTETPQAQQYCFTQESGQNGIFVNSYKQDSSESCQFDFVFPDAANANGLIQMQYFPIESITDTSNYQIYIPSSTTAMPRYTKYNLPSSITIPENFDYFIIKISNIPYELIDNIYYSTNDPINTSNGCTFTQFPDSNNGCSYTKISQSQSTVAIEFNVATTSSENYVAFYTKQSNDEQYLNLIVSSSIKCKEGYYYSDESSQCKVQTTSCTKGYYYNITLLKCVECSLKFAHCSQCESTGEYCTECSTGEGGQISLQDGKCLLSCESGKYPNPDISGSSLCLSCLAHCIQCISQNTCEECYEPTYKWNDTFHECENVCDKSQYYDTSSQSCVNCEVEYCTVCYGSGKQCSECNDGYEPVQSTSDDYACQKTQYKPKTAQKISICSFALLVILMTIFMEI